MEVSKKKSLYDINLEHRLIIENIEQMEGEITPEMEERLIINKSDIQVKSIAYLSVINSKETFVGQIDNEIKRLQALKKRELNVVDRLKSSLLDAVKVFGTIETKFNKFGTRKSQSVEVESVNQLPKEYKVITVTEKADKTLLKKALKEGKKIKGVELKDNLNLKIN